MKCVYNFTYMMHRSFRQVKAINREEKMKSFFKFITVFIIFSVGMITICFSGGSLSSMLLPDGSIKVTILYDNYIFTEGMQADWGFSCLIEGTEKTILFDTGTQPEILWHNIRKLNIDVSKIDMVAISHIHGDHTGGLFSILKEKQDVPVYIPASFPDLFVSRVNNSGGKAVRVDKPLEICKDVYLSGEMGATIKEQAIVLDTTQGLVIISGCAHPGIASMVNEVRNHHGKDVYFVLGGFHLMQHSPDQVKEIIEQFNQAGVKKCGATHCTGDNAIEIFKKAYGENFVGMGVGRVIEIES